MKNRTRRALALLLSVGCAASALAACTGKETDTSVAMGRYVEQEWSLPEEEPDILSALHRSADGRVALLACTRGVWSYYVTEDGVSWERQSPAWLGVLNDDRTDIYQLYSVHFNAKGEGVIAYMGLDSDDGEVRDCIYLVRPDGSATQSPIGETDPWPVRFSGEAATEQADGAESGGEDGTETPASDAAGTPPEVADEAQSGEEAVTTADKDDDVGAGDGETPLMRTWMLDSALMGEDGMVYVASYDHFGRFDPATGKLLADYLPAASASAVAGDQVVQLLTPYMAELSGFSISAYSLFFSDGKNGTIDRVVSAENLRLSGGVTLAAEADGTLYLTDSSGLYRIAPGGDAWEQLLDGSMSSLSTPSMHATDLVPHGEGEFAVLFSGDGYRLINYVYSPDTPTLPDNELTVYTMLSDKTLSQALGVFRQRYPNTLVNIRTSNDDDSGGNGDDARRALNTELLAGKGPDLFILTDLPLESYVEKGVLADISDVVQPLIDSGDLLPAPAGTYRRDGAIYAVPARIKVPTLWGDERALAAAGSLDSLLAYAERHPDTRLFGDMTPQHLLYQLASSEWDDLVDEQGGVNVDAVERLLAGVTALAGTADSAHAYRYFASADFTENITEQWHDMDGYWTEDLYAVVNRRAVCMPVTLNGFGSVMAPSGAVYAYGGGIPYDETGDGAWNTTVPDDMVDRVFRAFPDGGGFFPSSVIGVNAASAQQELARAFVEAMLSEETQTADLDDGFPIHRGAIAGNAARQETWFGSHSYNIEDEDERRELAFECNWPSTAMLEAVAGMLETLERPIGRNYSLGMQYGMEEWLMEALDQVVRGQATPREAAQAIAEGMRVALAE